MEFTDAVTVAGTRQTADGYLVATARTGAQRNGGRGHEVRGPEARA